MSSSSVYSSRASGGAVDAERRRARRATSAAASGNARLHDRPPLLEPVVVDVLELLDVHQPVADLDRRVARAARAGRPRRSPARAPARAPASRPRRRRSRSPNVRHSQRGTIARPRRGAVASARPQSPRSAVAKYSSALRVFVCCSPERSTPRPPRNARSLGRHLERLGRGAPRRELEHARAVRVEPHLGDEPPAELLRREAQLEHEDRPEHRQVVERDALGRVRRRRTRRCSFEKSLRSGRSTGGGRSARRSGRACPSASPSRRTRRAARRPRRGSSGDRRRSAGSSAGHDRPQLHDRVAALALDPARAHDDAVLVEREVRRIEEEDLADLRLQRIHARARPPSSAGATRARSASARRCRRP